MILWRYKCETFHRGLRRERLTAVQDRINSINRGFAFNTTPYPLIPACLAARDQTRYFVTRMLMLSTSMVIWILWINV